MRVLRPTLVFLLLLLTGSPGLHAQNWQWQHQAGSALGLDNNIFESPESGTGTLFSRLYLHFSGSGTLAPRWTASFDGQAGLQGYAAHSVENRSLCDLYARFRHDTADRLTLNTVLRFRGKSYFTADHGYQLPMIQTEAAVRLTHAWRSAVYMQWMQLDCSQGALYDHQQWEGGIKLLWAASRRIRMAWQAAGALRTYNRTAVNWNPDAYDQSPWTYASGRQEDRIWRVSWRLEYYQHMLLRLGIGFDKVTSNSTGFNYTQPSIQLTAARELSRKTMIHLKWAWRGKHYDDPLNPALQLRPDTESEDMNMAVLEVTRSLSPSALLSLRLGWYENESPYRNRYYQKTVTDLGVRIRF